VKDRHVLDSSDTALRRPGMTARARNLHLALPNDPMTGWLESSSSAQVAPSARGRVRGLRAFNLWPRGVCRPRTDCGGHPSWTDHPGLDWI